MTVSLQTPVKRHTANGISTVFAYDYLILDAADLGVYLDEASQSTGFTVSGVGSPTGGSVIFTTAPVSGVIVSLIREMDPTRSTNYENSGDFKANTVNPDFDRTWLYMQQLAEKLGRAPALSIASMMSDITFPEPGASQYIRWNNAGTDLETVSSVVSSGTFLQSGAGAVTREANAKMADVISVKDFGAVGNGTDEWQQIQNAINALTEGRTLEFEGDKTYYISKPLAWMANKQWKTIDFASSTDIEMGTHINGNGCIIRWMSSVPWTGVFPDQPYPERPIANITIDTREPRLLTIGNVDYGSIRNLILDGNMEARALVSGNPGARENEHALMIIGCRGFLVDNVATTGTMGDGIYVGYAYNVGAPSTSSFRNGTGVSPAVIQDGNMCQNITVRKTRHYSHSRQGVSVVGCIGGHFEDIYSESIDSVTNFTSAAGPGATIDFESNPDGSVVSGITFNGIVAKNHKVTGPLCILRATDIVGSSVQCIQTNVTVTYPIQLGGDISSINISDVIIDGASGSNNTMIYCGSGVSAPASPRNVSVNNITMKGAKFNYFCRVFDNAKLSISDVKGDFEPADATQGIIWMNSTNSGQITLINIDINVPSGSIGCASVFRADINGTIKAQNFRITAPDAVPIAQSTTHGLINCTGTGNTIEINNAIFDVKAMSLIAEGSTTLTNTITVTNGWMKGASSWPSLSPVANLYIDGFKVASCWNNASATRDAMLLLYLKANQTWKLRNIESYSQGAYSYNKCSAAGLIKTDSASFDTLSNCSVVIEGMTHLGGRSSDNSYSLQAYANGVNVSQPWDRTLATAKNLIRASKININDSINGLPFSTTTSATQSILWAGVTGNIGFWPNGKIIPKPNSNGAGAAVTYYWREHDSSGTASGNHITMYFSGAPAGSSDWELITL